jgi:hypothetical protein
MKNWKAIAKAANPDLPDAQIEGIAAPLEALEQTFRPLAESLPPGLEPLLELGDEEDGL